MTMGAAEAAYVRDLVELHRSRPPPQFQRGSGNAPTEGGRTIATT
jgi:hypothetical protein